MNLAKLGYGLLLSSCLAIPVQAESVVNFYNWADYIDPAVLESFKQESGISVHYDVVVPTGAFLERQIPAGVYTKLDKSKLPNLSNIDPEIAAKITVHDQGNLYSVPYTWGTIGLGYNPTMLSERLGEQAVDTWDVLFKPELVSKLADRGVFVLDSPAEIISVALNYLGLDPNSESKKDLAKATELLEQIRPYVRNFTSSDYGNSLSNGDACLAVGYNGDILMAQVAAMDADNGIEVAYSIPSEGTMIWFDLMAIPADAPNPEAAYQFINYLLEPQSAAGISNYAYFAVPNLKVEPLLAEEVTSDPNIYPSDEVKAKLFSQQSHSPKFDRRLSRAWTNIKAGI